MFTKCKVKTVFLVLTAFFSVSAFSAELNADSKSVQKENSSNAAPPEVQFVQELQTILETGDLDKAIASSKHKRRRKPSFNKSLSFDFCLTFAGSF